jgi:hypothetical protein
MEKFNHSLIVYYHIDIHFFYNFEKEVIYNSGYIQKQKREKIEVKQNGAVGQTKPQLLENLRKEKF